MASNCVTYFPLSLLLDATTKYYATEFSDVGAVRLRCHWLRSCYETLPSNQLNLTNKQTKVQLNQIFYLSNVHKEKRNVSDVATPTQWRFRWVLFSHDPHRRPPSTGSTASTSAMAAVQTQPAPPRVPLAALTTITREFHTRLT